MGWGLEVVLDFLVCLFDFGVVSWYILLCRILSHEKWFFCVGVDYGFFVEIDLGRIW